jgi:hypothetical protein
MADQDKHEDRLADRNLRMIGRLLQLPADPTPRQRADWKRIPGPTQSALDAEHPSAPHRSARFVRRHRLLTVATSAIAAAIILAVLLVMPGGAAVQASTILDSLRQTLLDGFRIELADLGQDGIHIDGRFIVTLKPSAEPGGQPVDAFDPARLGYDSFYSDVHLWTDDSRDEAAGLDVQVTVALSEQARWAYLKTSRLPQRLLKEEPLAWLLFGLTRTGVMFDLEGLLGTFQALAPDATGTDQGGLRTMASKMASSLPGQQLTDRGEVKQLFLDFVAGRATAEQINQVFSLIAEAARDASIVEVTPGLYLLTASDFKLEALDTDDAAMLADMRLEITYRAGSGLESAALTNLGQYAGTLRLSPPGGAADQNLFDRKRLVEPGVTRVCDLSVFRPLLERWEAGRD